MPTPPDTQTMDSSHAKKSVLWSLAGITVFGLMLRLLSINSRGLWLDEAITVLQARQNLPKVVRTLQEGVHPPLFHILVHFWITAFGATEVAVRSYAMMWGVLAIPAAYWATRVVYDRRSGLIAAGIVAVSPYLVWYSQEARMYTMMLFFAFMSLGFFASAVRTNRKRDWVGYTVFTFFGMFTHYFYAFLVMGEFLYFIVVEVIHAHRDLKSEGRAVFTWRRPLTLFSELPKVGPWAISMALLGGSYVLWLSRSVFMNPAENSLVSSATGQGLGYGQPPPVLAFRFNDAGRVVFEMFMGFQPDDITLAMVAAWPLIIMVTLVLFDYVGYLARRSLIIVWAALGLLIVLALGQWQGQVLASRYFIAVAAPGVILTAGVLGAMPRGRRRGVLIAALLFSLVAWFSQSYSPGNTLRFQYREAFNAIAEGHEPGDVVIYEPFYMRPVILYYLPAEIPAFAYPEHGDFGVVRRGKPELAEDLARTTDLSRRVWVVLSFQDIAVARGDAYNTVKWFERNGFELAESTDYRRVRVLRFDRENPEQLLDLMEVSP